MVNNMISRAAVLLAALASTASAGKAIIQNSCSFPVYLSSVSNVAGPTQELAANGGTYSEDWRSNPNGGGISIKIASDSSFSQVTQFEYTLESPDLWYDLSNINGYPFEQWGVSIIPSDSSCNEVICPAGVSLCAAAYNTPTEDWATAMCYSASDMVVLLCSGAKDTSDTSPSSLTSTVAATSTKATSTSVKATSTVVPVSSTSVKATSVAPVVSSTSVKATSVAPAPTTTTFSTSTTITSASSVASSSTEDNGVVVQTTFVTQVVTVVGTDAPASSDVPAATTTTDDRRPTWTGRPHWTGIARRHEHHARRHGAQQ